MYINTEHVKTKIAYDLIGNTVKMNAAVYVFQKKARYHKHYTILDSHQIQSTYTSIEL